MNHDPNGYFAEYLRHGTAADPAVAKTIADRALLTALKDCTKYASWEKISFRVFGLCHKDARTQVGEYVRLAWDCVNTDITAAIAEARLLKIGSDDREHSIEWAVENIRKTNCYEGWEEELRYLMYRYEEAHAHGNVTNEQWERIWEQSAAHYIEHIQPQSSGAPYVHFLGNLMLLTPGLNSILNNKKPAQKTADYRGTGLHAATEVAQTIESDGWGLAQVEQREQQLLEWVRQTWG